MLGLRPVWARGGTESAFVGTRKDSSRTSDPSLLFEEFVQFMQQEQIRIIDELEQMERDNHPDDDYDDAFPTFSRDPWGCYAADQSTSSSGGITRVLQNKRARGIIAKGACSLTVLRNGTLSAERATTISARQNETSMIKPGDIYHAAALSMVLHSNHPYIPTFRSDVRVFWVEGDGSKNIMWLGGGADLTPYYLFPDDISRFHSMYADLCRKYSKINSPAADPEMSYHTMKRACDDYFFLPARREHRGTGGIFFDDLMILGEGGQQKENASVFHERQQGRIQFAREMVQSAWMASWLPTVERHRRSGFTPAEEHWMFLRRGRYLEFNLLYDRGVKFGLQGYNPRVEGTMVSAPPLIAYEYNFQVDPDSREDELLDVLKQPKEWVAADGD
jgi:coproporphyrinogen III oxidase